VNKLLSTDTVSQASTVLSNSGGGGGGERGRGKDSRCGRGRVLDIRHRRPQVSTVDG
jgi:hypothetical protein